MIAGLLGKALLPASPALAQTQMEMTADAGKAFSAADTEMNQIYQQLTAKLSPAGKTALRDAQRAWLRYRDLECPFETMGTVGGSVHPMLVYMCQKRLTKAHIADLTTQLNCQEGDVACGGQ
jgi:uncharacterized protein YecT (DUF1311 family)